MITQTLTYGCDAQNCAVEHAAHVPYPQAVGFCPVELPRPCVPEGWTLVHGRLYCPRHRVTVMVKERK